MGWEHAEASTAVGFAILRRRTPGKSSQQADQSEYAEIHRCLGGEEHAPFRNSALFATVSLDFQSCTEQAYLVGIVSKFMFSIIFQLSDFFAASPKQIRHETCILRTVATRISAHCSHKMKTHVHYRNSSYIHSEI